MAQQNPFFIPPLVYAALAAGAIGFTAWQGYRAGRQDMSHPEVERLTGDINRQGGVLSMSQPVFPAPAAPQTAEEMRTFTPEEMIRRTNIQSRLYQLDFSPVVTGTPLPTGDRYTNLEKGLAIGVAGLALWAMLK